LTFFALKLVNNIESMNITELARQVHIPVERLREILPELGFDVGLKAIQVDDHTALKIIEKLHHPNIKEKFLFPKKEAPSPSAAISPAANAEKKDKTISIGEKIVVKDLANLMNLPVTRLILELMKNGVMASLNQSIDYETATIIAEDLGYQTEKINNNCPDPGQEKKDRASYFVDEEKNLIPRPPVIVVMGHVDHGKTKLLDAIRETNVADGEAGGITQHIGAYQVKKNNQILTFIDTPGHEAFSAMRSRGAQVADIAILVVAADDGIQQQTIEAISHIRSAGLPFIVAINKIDKPDANLDKIRSGLADLGLTPEAWGGKTICVEISAKQKTNIDGLLETLLLVYELEKDKITANPNRAAVGTIIEAHVDKGEGPVATIIVQTGILKIGDTIKIGDTVGKIRNLKNWRGHNINQALPSDPVKIIGLKNAPEVGEIIQVLTDLKEWKKEAKKNKGYKNNLVPTKNTSVRPVEEIEKIKKINVILKCDVLGSLEALVESLNNLSQPELMINIIQASLGNITEIEVERAEKAPALLIGFNVRPTPQAETIARDKNITIKTARIIYELIDYVKAEMNKNFTEEIKETELGRAKVIKIFRTEKKSQIIGVKIIAGKITKEAKIKIIRHGEIIGQTIIKELQSGRQVVSEVVEGQEAGLLIDGFNQAEENDELYVYLEEKIRKVI